MTLLPAETPSPNRFFAGMAAGAALTLVLVGAVVLLNRGGSGSGTANPSGQPAALPFGPAEQAYAAQIHTSGLRLSQATNMLNQQFTYVVGTVANAGPRPVRAMEVTVEFHDQIRQVVLRDTARLFPPGADPLAANGQRDFQLAVENVPASWDRQPPSIRVTGLDLQ
jgi:hypothetical protein